MSRSPSEQPRSSRSLLIVIRGPSGAGKSSIAQIVAEELRKRGRATALVHQDHVRRVMLGEGGKFTPSNVRHLKVSLMKAIASECLQQGLAVVLEGVLSCQHYQSLVGDLVGSFDESFEFFLRVSKATTVARHEMRDKRDEFSADEMLQWWFLAVESASGRERVLDTDDDESATVTAARLLSATEFGVCD